MITLGVTNDRKANTGVTRCSFDDGITRTQVAARFGLHDNSERCTVFDRAAGIHELGLSKDFAACQFRQTAQPDERSFANVLLNPMKTRGAPTIAFSHLCLSTFVLL